MTQGTSERKNIIVVMKDGRTIKLPPEANEAYTLDELETEDGNLRVRAQNICPNREEQLAYVGVSMR